MATYSIIRQGDSDEYGYVEAVVDLKSDIAGLPSDWTVGSNCLCLEDSSVWVLGNDREWHEL